MKKILLLLTFVSLSLNAAAPNQNFDVMSEAEQIEYVEDVAKEIRKEYWVTGYDDVDSYSTLVKKEFLNEYVAHSQNSRYEEPLGDAEVSELYRCFYRSHCQLYHISVSASMYGGYGVESHFLSLYPETKKNEIFRHTVYAE